MEKKKLWKALVTSAGLLEILEEKVKSEEYNFASNGGEPDLEHLLCVRLLECLTGEKVFYSLLHDADWREHALQKEK